RGQQGAGRAQRLELTPVDPCLPLSTLRRHPRRGRRTTRGRRGPLRLRRIELASTTPHRLWPAHPDTSYRFGTLLVPGMTPSVSPPPSSITSKSVLCLTHVVMPFCATTS